MKKVQFSEKIFIHEFSYHDPLQQCKLQTIQIAADQHRFQMRIEPTNLLSNEML